MTMQISIRVRSPLDKKAREFNGELKKGVTKAFQAWQEDALPKHFVPIGQANARYGGIFKARTKAYEIRKAKNFGHRNVLQFDGGPTSLKGNVTRNRVVVTGSRNEFRARLPGSNKANFSGSATRPTHTGHKTVTLPNMRDELTAVNQAEGQAIADVVDQHMTDYLHPDSSDPYETFQVT